MTDPQLALPTQELPSQDQQSRSASFLDYLSLIKFSHTVFALPFALLGFFVAVWKDGYALEWSTLALIIACMVLARTSAMAFNRWADRRLDALNDRTRRRELPSGVIRERNALWLALLSAAAFIVAAYFINPICFYLSPLALAIILGYSFTKRFTSLSHLILGLGLSLAPTGAYLAVGGVFGLVPILISIAVLFWVSGFDVIYALQDTAFDRAHRLRSIPAALGETTALWLSVVLHAFTAVALAAAGIVGEFGWMYWIGYAVFGAMLIYQHTLVRPHDISRVNLAFFTANGIASVIFAAFAIADLWRTSDGAGVSN
jgi:4-hydroxybenzoate polyprenyltransferase